MHVRPKKFNEITLQRGADESAGAKAHFHLDFCFACNLVVDAKDLSLFCTTLDDYLLLQTRIHDTPYPKHQSSEKQDNRSND